MEHLKYLAWFNYLFAALLAFTTAIVALAGLAVVGSLMMAPEVDMTSMLISGISIGVAGLLCAGLTVLYIVAGRRVSKGQGRILQSVLSVMSVGNPPIGTLYGLYGLWVCWFNEDTKKIFEEPYSLIE